MPIQKYGINSSVSMTGKSHSSSMHFQFEQKVYWHFVSELNIRKVIILYKVLLNKQKNTSLTTFTYFNCYRCFYMLPNLFL